MPKPKPPLSYPGPPAPTPKLSQCFPAINKAIQGQTGQTQPVILNPVPQQIEEIVQALGPATCLCKIGVTVQNCVDTDGKPLENLKLTRCSVFDCEEAMYNSMVFERRPLGLKTDGMVLALTTNQKMLNWLEDSLSKGAPGSVNSNGGGGGSHHLEPFSDGPSKRLGIVYKMTPKAATLEEYRDDCKVRSLPRRSDFLLPLTEILTVFMMYADRLYDVC